LTFSKEATLVQSTASPVGVLSQINLTLWLEDKHDFKNSLDDCLQVDLNLKQFAKLIAAENLNSYEGTKMHPTKKFVYKDRIEISKPIKWYLEDASPAEQQWARDAMLKALLTQLVETEVYDGNQDDMLFV